MKVTQRLQDLFHIDESSFVRKHEDSAQREFAPILRATVINHLAAGAGVVARGFRGEYSAANGGHYKNFLAKQEKNGVWATDIEATAMGELLGCNIVVTQVTKGKNVATYCLYRTEEKNAPTIHLYNSNNTHWYTAHGNTIGDGNCLYNAIAKEVQRLCRNESNFKLEAQPTDTQYLARNGFFGTTKSTSAKTAAIIESQTAIAEAIVKTLKPSELEAQQRAEQERMSKLSPEERAQIAKDYKYALKVAAEEITISRK